MRLHSAVNLVTNSSSEIYYMQPEQLEQLLYSMLGQLMFAFGGDPAQVRDYFEVTITPRRRIIEHNRVSRAFNEFIERGRYGDERDKVLPDEQFEYLRAHSMLWDADRWPADIRELLAEFTRDFEASTEVMMSRSYHAPLHYGESYDIDDTHGVHTHDIEISAHHADVAINHEVRDIVLALVEESDITEFGGRVSHA